MTIFFKKLTTITMTLAIVGGIVFSVGDQPSNYLPEAVTTQTQRRVYVYLAGAWDGSDMYIHYLGGAVQTDWSACPVMTKVVSDYYQGLFYYDLSMDTTDFLVKSASGYLSKLSNQSEDIKVSSLLVGTNYFGVRIGAWVKDSDKRTRSYVETIPMSSLQFAAVLNNINSCSTSYAGGYNAWPQLNDLFIIPSTLDGSTLVEDNYGPSTTISAKNSFLQNRYTIDKAS